MFTVEKLQITKSANEQETSINLEARRECEDIMRKIYEENPSYWPYGLDMSAHDGGVYMIREASTKKAIGFTGWQERMQGTAKVGFYSIGILPEYRNNGYAKQAVAKLISIKAANVDRVQALVMKHNKPSLALAESLHVPVIKAGSEKKAMTLGKRLLAGSGLGLGAAGFMDALTFGREKTWDEYKKEPLTVSRLANALLNTGLGGAALVPGIPASVRATMLTSIPIKDLALTSIPAVQTISHGVKDMSENSLGGLISKLSPAGKAVGAAGLLGGGTHLRKAARRLRPGGAPVGRPGVVHAQHPDRCACRHGGAAPGPGATLCGRQPGWLAGLSGRQPGAAASLRRGDGRRPASLGRFRG